MEGNAMRQSKFTSMVEAKVNAVVGLTVSWLFTFYGLPLFGIEPSVSQATWITAAYFLLSFGRSYVLRRVFNTPQVHMFIQRM